MIAWPEGATFSQGKSMCMKACCREINTEIPNNKIIRKTMARSRPMFRALLCCSLGSREAVMEIKMMLSIPKTISKNVKVNKLTILSTESNDSIKLFFSCKDGVFQADNQSKVPQG